MKLSIASAALVAALLTTLPATAQFQRPEQAIKYRQSVMVLQGTHLGRMFAMANGRVPFDAKVALENAVLLDVIDQLPFAAFGEGTDKGGITRAKPEIWTERAKFDAMAAKLQEETAKLVVAARTGQLDPFKAAVGAVGQSCNACHDAYQRPAN